MLEITARAATVIAHACSAQDLSESGGLRITPNTTNNGAVRSLRVEFVDGPSPTDTVVQEGPANVFLADGLERLVGAACSTPRAVNCRRASYSASRNKPADEAS